MNRKRLGIAAIAAGALLVLGLLWFVSPEEGGTWASPADVSSARSLASVEAERHSVAALEGLALEQPEPSESRRVVPVSNPAASKGKPSRLGCWLSILVLDGEEKPLADIPVCLVSLGRDPSEPTAFTRTRPKYISRWERTNSEGWCLFEDIAPGGWRAYAKDSNELYYSSAAIRVRKGAERVSAMVFVREPEGKFRIEGRVLDEAGSPLSGARVAFIDKDVAVTHTAVTDPHGAFALFDEHELGSGSLYAASPDDPYLQAVKRGVKGGDRALVLQLVQARSTRVDVWGAGEGLNDTAEIEFAVEGSRDGRPFDETSKQDLGEEDRTVLRLPLDPFRITVEHEGFQTLTTELLDPDSIGKSMRIDLEPWPRVRVRVLANGVPVPDARLTLEDAELMSHAADAEFYEFASMGVGEASVVVKHPMLGQLESKRFELPMKDPVELLLEYVDVGALAGRVVLPNALLGREDLWLLLSNDEFERSAAAEIRADGTFMVPAIRAGNWSMSLGEMVGGKLSSRSIEQWLEEVEASGFTQAEREELMADSPELFGFLQALPYGTRSVRVVANETSHVAVDFRE